MKEEVQPPYNVGNLVVDLNLNSIFSDEDLQQKSFSFFPFNQFASKFFSLDIHSYAYQYLTLHHVFDREVHCQIVLSANLSNKCACLNYHPFKCHLYLVLVLAPVQNTPIHFVIKIDIEDINDNAPTFPESEIHLSISEDSAVNTRLNLQTAEDVDWQTNSYLHYRISSNEHFDLSYVYHNCLNKSLSLRLVQPLDRESQDMYTLTIYVTDSSNDTTLSGSALIKITISDVNDCYPVFQTIEQSINILENAQVPNVLVKVRATDMDLGDNGRIFYSIEAQPHKHISQLFKINQYNGELILVSQPDREKEQNFSLIIWANDNGASSKSTSLKISVTILDVNDNSPIINGPRVTEIYENNKTPTTLATYEVVDPDLLNNISCVLSNIDGSNLTLSLEQSESSSDNKVVYKLTTNTVFDREVQSEYVFFIICRDGSSISAKATNILINLQIFDINDNFPQFLTHKIVVNIKESYVSPNGDPVAQVVATDKDSDLNGNVEYFIISTDQPVFTIHLITGHLFLLSSLDFERGSVCLVVIGAKDGGEPSRTSSVTITFHIVDVNDNAPKLDRRKTLSISENNAVGAILGLIRVTDEDGQGRAETGAKLRSKSMEFSLFDKQLVALVSFDRESRKQYRVAIEMTDFGEPPLTSIDDVVVEILDENDNDPFIISPLVNEVIPISFSRFEVDEEIYRVTAHDNDAGINGTLHYFIEPVSAFFQIDVLNGSIRLRRRLSRLDLGNITIGVVVRDCGVVPRESTTVLTVYVMDTPPISWGQIKTFINSHKWRGLMVFVLFITATSVIVGISFWRRSRSNIQRNKVKMSTRTSSRLDTNKRERIESRMILTDKKYLYSQAKKSDIIENRTFNRGCYNENGSINFYSNEDRGTIQNHNIIVHKSIVSNSDSGHGESAESRQQVDVFPNIEVILRESQPFCPSKSVHYSIDWKCKQSETLRQLRLPESNSIGVLSSISSGEHYEKFFGYECL